MKRFLQKSYSWLTMLFLAVAFAVSGNVAAQTEITFGSNEADYQVMTFKKDGISVTGFGYNCGYAAWGDYPSLNMFVDADAGPRTITVSVPTGTIEKIEMTTTKENGTNSNFKDVTVNTGSFSANGNSSAEWTGSASEVVFTPGENTNVYVNKIIVYASGVEAGGEDGGDTGDGAEAKAVELPFAFTTSAGGTVDGVGFYMWSANWTDATELYGQGDSSATWGTVNLTCAAANIIKVELTCRTNSWSGVGSDEAAAATVCETENLEGYFSYNGNVATWVGAAHSLTFSSSDDIDVYKIVVYTLADGVVKECVIDVDHYADNCKPGKCEYITKYITLYMQGNATATSWTGKDNCPEGVTLTNEAGQEFAVSQFNYWKDSDQLGIVLAEEITEPGVYTLHIPEGLMPFQDSKWNKEINVVYVVTAPDTREQKQVTFDYAQGFVAEAEGITSATTGDFNSFAQGLQLKADRTLSFTAPANASIVGVTLTHTNSGLGQGLQVMTAEGDELATISVADDSRTLTWAGDAQTVTFKSGYNTYIATALVTLAVEGSDEPVYVEPVLKAEDVSANVAYYIYTEARGGLTVESADATSLVGTAEAGVGQDVDPTDARQQFAFVNWEGNLYLYNVATEKFIGKANRGNFTDEPVDPIYFKNADENTVMLYFDDSFNINLGGSKQVTIDGWKQKDAGNSFIIKVAEPFDQTPIFDKLNGGGEVDPDVPAIALSELEGEWFFMGEGAYCNAPDNTDGSLSPKNVYTVNMAIEGDKLLVTGLVGYIYDTPNSMIGTYDAAAGTLTIKTPYEGTYIVDGNYEYYLLNGPLVLNVSKDEAGNIVFSNENGWKFWYEDWYYTRHECGYTSVRMTRDADMPEVEPNPELLKFAGNYLFQGVNPESNEAAYTTNEYYDCEVTVYGNELHMTGLLGEVDGKLPYLIGKYDAEQGRIKFSHPGADGGFISAANGVKYYMDYFYVYVEGEEGNYVLTHPNNFIFYAYVDGYTKCSYDSFKFIQNGEIPEVTIWNGNVLFSSASAMDELLTLTLNFEGAQEVKSSGFDVLGAIFDGNGNPYALVQGNEAFSIFGNVAFEGSKANIEFVKISDLNAQLREVAKSAAARIGGFNQTPGEACVVFAGKSFKVDGELVNEILSHEYTIAGSGTTAIETIETESNDSVIYDLSGRRVKTAGSGLYIKNGVKVYMK